MKLMNSLAAAITQRLKHQTQHNITLLRFMSMETEKCVKQIDILYTE